MSLCRVGSPIGILSFSGDTPCAWPRFCRSPWLAKIGEARDRNDSPSQLPEEENTGDVRHLFARIVPFWKRLITMRHVTARWSRGCLATISVVPFWCATCAGSVLRDGTGQKQTCLLWNVFSAPACQPDPCRGKSQTMRHSCPIRLFYWLLWVLTDPPVYPEEGLYPLMRATRDERWKEIHRLYPSLVCDGEKGRRCQIIENVPEERRGGHDV